MQNLFQEPCSHGCKYRIASQLPKDLYELVDLVKAGRLQAERLVRQRFPLADIQAAFEASVLGLGGRTLIDIG